MNFVKFLISIVLVTILSPVNASRVLELSDRFLDVRQEGMWFIKFYAPYCGYCKKMEPTWIHVAQALFQTNIRVGKIDCTRFKSACQAFKVQGYPTIVFIRGNNEYVYQGERSKDELVHFAMRMSGPTVQQVTRPESFEILKSNNPVFFVYIGQQLGHLWNIYAEIAEKNQAQAYFYSTSLEVASKHFLVFIDQTPLILVYKENSHYIFPASETTEAKHLDDWVTQEKFLTFPKVSRENMYYLKQTKKFLVLAVVEENKLNELATHEAEFKDMIEQIIRSKRSKYHENFQFGWIGNPDISHTIAMDTMDTPHLLVINSTSNVHHIPDDDPLQMTEESIEIFLESVLAGEAVVLGGDAFFVRLRRALFELRRLLADMWIGNPVLTCVIFGLPLGFLSLICYSIFCADILDADPEDEHEKKE